VPDPVIVREVVSRVAPLAFRFHDELLGVAVGDGLEVTAWPTQAPATTVAAAVGPSGVFAFPSLPGLLRLPPSHSGPPIPVAFGEGDLAYWAGLPPPRPFTIGVADPWGRFLPCVFQTAAPSRGLALPACLSQSHSGPPSDGEQGVPLFSAPTRAVQAPVAVVRAELWDPLAGSPAAWALVEGRLGGGPPFRGLADALGRLTLLIPYPPPDDPFTSPPASFLPGLGPPLTEQEWPLSLSATYTPQLPAPQAPDLCSVLAQAPVTLWARYADRVPLDSLTVRYGRELVVRSEDTDPPAGSLRVTA